VSPAEYFELIGMAGDSAAMHAMNAVTIYFAYLVAVYLVGGKLTRFQTIALTVIYSVFLTVPVMSCLVTLKLMTVHAQQFLVEHPDLSQAYPFNSSAIFRSYFFYTNAVVWVVAWVLSVLFMFSKRRDRVSSS